MAVQMSCDISLTTTNTSEVRAMEDDIEFILYKHLPDMVRSLVVPTFRIYLRAEGVLSDDEMAKLDPHPPDYVGSQILETLAKLIKQKGERGLQKFMTALRRSVEVENDLGHAELLNILENDQGIGGITDVRQHETQFVAGEVIAPRILEGTEEESAVQLEVMDREDEERSCTPLLSAVQLEIMDRPRENEERQGEGDEQQREQQTGVKIEREDEQEGGEDEERRGEDEQEQAGRVISIKKKYKFCCAYTSLGIVEFLLLGFGLYLLIIGATETDADCGTVVLVINLYHGCFLCVIGIVLPLSLVGRHWKLNRYHYSQYLDQLQCCLKWTIISLLFTFFMIFVLSVLFIFLGIVGEFYFAFEAPSIIYPVVKVFDNTIGCSPTAFYTAFAVLVSLHVVVGGLVVVGIVFGIVYICATFKDWFIP